MAISIDEVEIVPNPVPSDTDFVCATVRIKSDSPAEAVIAYPPEGDSLRFEKQEEGVFTLKQFVTPYAFTPGVYDVLVVARDAEGNTARETVSVTIL